MMAWEITHIFDGDYGCEELQPGEKAKVSVTLVNEKGETKVLSVEDQWLLDKNLSEGSIWPEQTAFIKYHLSPQKCSPFQGASSACPRQKLPDSRGKFSPFKIRAVKETLFERTQASFILHSADKRKVI